MAVLVHANRLKGNFEPIFFYFYVLRKTKTSKHTTQNVKNTEGPKK
jgi:hypothetical protein